MGNHEAGKRFHWYIVVLIVAYQGTLLPWQRVDTCTADSCLNHVFCIFGGCLRQDQGKIIGIFGIVISGKVCGVLVLLH